MGIFCTQECYVIHIYYSETCHNGISMGLTFGVGIDRRLVYTGKNMLRLTKISFIEILFKVVFVQGSV